MKVDTNPKRNLILGEFLSMRFLSYDNDFYTVLFWIFFVLENLELVEIYSSSTFINSMKQVQL